MSPALVFDIDDTLYAREQPFAAACREVFGIAADRALYKRFQRYGDRLFEENMVGRISLDRMHIDRIRLTMAERGIDVPDDAGLRFQQTYSGYQSRIMLTPVLEDMLQELSQAGVPMYALTNGVVSKQVPKYRALGLERFIPRDHLIVSEEAGASKPDIAVFRYAETAWGLRPEDIVFIGDSYDHDIRGAKNAGWRTVWYDREGAGHLGADRTVTSEEELAAYLISTYANGNGE